MQTPQEMANPATTAQPAPARTAPVDGRADLGLLCVHGIGTQAEGDSVLAVAAPLLGALAGDGGRVVYGDAVLKPQRQSARGPAHLRAQVGQGAETTDVLVAESWWAQAFDPPSYWELLAWLLSYGTWIAIRHTVFRISAPVRWLERHYERRGQPLPDWLAAGSTLFAIPGALVSIFLVAIPLQLVLLAIGVLALLPLRATQQAAKRAALAVSAVLGDASVYTANDAIRMAIRTRVKNDLAWLCKRSKRVVVLAHSQGAAVVFDLLRSVDDLSKIHLVTYGAGIRKLSELEQDARGRPLMVRLCSVLWLLGLAGGVMAWYAAAYTVESFAGAGEPLIGDRVGSLLFFYLLVLVIFFSFFYHTAHDREGEIDQRLLEDAQGLLAKKLHWADLYASSDPVPGGPLLGAHALASAGEGWQADATGLPGFRSRRVVNRLSTFADHTSYWQGPNDFMPALAAQIRDWLGLARDPGAMNLGRMRRMFFRKLAGFMLAVAAVAVFIRAGQPLRDAVLVPAWDLLPIDPASMTGRILAHYQLRGLAIGALGLVAHLGLVLAYGRFVLDPAWNAWERTVQCHRAGAFADRSGLAGWLQRAAHRAGPALRALVCLLLFALALGLLASVAARAGFGPALQSFILVGEWGREVLAWAVLGLVLLGAVGAVFAAVEWLRERRRAAAETSD